MSHRASNLGENQQNQQSSCTPCLQSNYRKTTISIYLSLKFVLKGQINNIPELDQIMAWRRPGDKPFFWTNDG